MSSRTLRHLIGAGAVTGLAFLGMSAVPASAHVTIDPPVQPADSYTVLTVAVPHGCDGSPTTAVRIQMPEEIPAVTPTVNPNWDVEMVNVELDEPIEGAHGETLTERVGEVVYTAKTPLADDLRDAFELSLKTPDLIGETLAFPIIQTCEDGETAWVELATDGVDAHDLDEPAPTITLVAADANDTPDTGGDGSETSAPATEGGDDGGSGSSNTLGIIALVVGAVGVALGGTAIARDRRTA